MIQPDHGRIGRRGFLQAAGLLGGTLVLGDFLPLLAEAGGRTDTLRVAVERDFESLRPEVSAGDTNFTLKRLIYATLILWGTKQRRDGTLIYDPESIEPRLATGYHVSPDQRTITFTIRKEARFANGDPIDAPAIKASYGWFHDTGGSGANQLKVNGLASKDNIEVVDAQTLRLHLDRPVAWGLIGNALLSSCSIVHAGEIRKHASADDPLGVKWLETNTIESGPYVIESWQKGSAMVLRANPHFYNPLKIQRILLQVVPDPSTRRIVLEKGDVDLATEIATKDVPALARQSGVKILSYPSTRTWWLGMSWRKEPFNDPHVRRAVAWAVPYEAIMQVVTHGQAVRHYSPIPANCSGYTGEYWPYETNLEKARAELAQSPFAGGFEVNFPVFTGYLFDEETSLLLRESLGQLGIKLHLQKMPIGQKNTLLVQKQVDMAVYTWGPWVPDAGYFIHWNWLPDSYWNIWSYANPEAQRPGEEVITMATGSPDRNEKLRRFQQVVCEEVGVIPLFAQIDNYVMRERVKGFVYYPDRTIFMDKLSLG